MNASYLNQPVEQLQVRRKTPQVAKQDFVPAEPDEQEPAEEEQDPNFVPADPMPETE